jgi:hypothetical protein
METPTTFAPRHMFGWALAQKGLADRDKRARNPHRRLQIALAARQNSRLDPRRAKVNADGGATTTMTESDDAVAAARRSIFTQAGAGEAAAVADTVASAC